MSRLELVCKHTIEKDDFENEVKTRLNKKRGGVSIEALVIMDECRGNETGNGYQVPVIEKKLKNLFLTHVANSIDWSRHKYNTWVNKNIDKKKRIAAKKVVIMWKEPLSKLRHHMAEIYVNDVCSGKEFYRPMRGILKTNLLDIDIELWTYNTVLEAYELDPRLMYNFSSWKDRDDIRFLIIKRPNLLYPSLILYAPKMNGCTHCSTPIYLHSYSNILNDEVQGGVVKKVWSTCTDDVVWKAKFFNLYVD